LSWGLGLKPGLPHLSAHHDGREYRFADPAKRYAFLADPDRFVPGNGGRCTVSQIEHGAVVAGDPHHGVLYRGRLYLCADRAAQRQFLREPQRYAAPRQAIAAAPERFVR
jgi:hypothetical protein